LKLVRKSQFGGAGGCMAAKKKASGGGNTRALRDVVASTVTTDSLIDLVERLGLVDLVIGRVKSRIEETDVDELFDEIADYLKRNPEVLVVSLGAITVATGMLVYLNSRRAWDGSDRRGTGVRASSIRAARARKAS
jgi:hypothetical protein